MTYISIGLLIAQTCAVPFLLTYITDPKFSNNPISQEVKFMKNGAYMVTSICSSVSLAVFTAKRAILADVFNELSNVWSIG